MNTMFGFLNAGLLWAQNQFQGFSKRRRKYCMQRYDWRRGPTPKVGSRRWRAREHYREAMLKGR